VLDGGQFLDVDFVDLTKLFQAIMDCVFQSMVDQLIGVIFSLQE
jgi:hypothetical protein